MGIANAMGGQGSGFILMFIMFGIFYFLLIRPQQKKMKEHQDMINALQKGDKVITSGGIHGVISDIKDTDIILEVADKVKIKITRVSIAVKL